MVKKILTFHSFLFLLLSSLISTSLSPFLLSAHPHSHFIINSQRILRVHWVSLSVVLLAAVTSYRVFFLNEKCWKVYLGLGEVTLRRPCVTYPSPRLTFQFFCFCGGINCSDYILGQEWTIFLMFYKYFILIVSLWLIQFLLLCYLQEWILCIWIL